MIVSINKKYRTRDGKSVRILCTDRNSEFYPVVALVGEGCIATTYTIEGRLVHQSDPRNNYESLIEVTEWDDFNIDEPVMVRDHNKCSWKRRHFAGVQGGRPTTWQDGMTSWSLDSDEHTRCVWLQCRRPMAEELR